MPGPKPFFWISASVADAAGANLNGIKTLLANGINTISIKGNQLLVMIVKIDLKMILILLFYGICLFYDC